jgi:acetyl esterase/lipase
MFKSWRIHVAGCLVAMSAAAFAENPTPTYQDVPYAVMGTRALSLDLYLPEDAAGPTPVVVFIHGGGWSGGSPYPIPRFCATLVERGIAVASVEYRLTSEAGQYGPDVAVTFPAQIQDVKGAVRWLRAHAADYNLRSGRIGAWGTSAGGHLAALLGTSAGVPELEGDTGGNLAYSSRIQACVDYYGPASFLDAELDVTVPPGAVFDHDAPESPESRLIGWDGADEGIGDIRAHLADPHPPYFGLIRLCELANPQTFVAPSAPPFFIAHGTEDRTVPIQQSTRLAHAFELAGVFCDYRQVVGAGHGNVGAATDDAAIEFLVQHLQHPPPPGDLDDDGDVDLVDYARLCACWSGPAQLPAESSCSGADLDGDKNVDLADVAVFEACFGGAGQPAACE